MKTGSPYAKIIPGSSGTTDIVFSHANIPPGTFNLERTGARINSKILLNTHNNDCFQRGIPRIADSIDTAAPWLAQKVKELGGTTLRVIGLSAGASAAIVYGHLLGADAVISVAPEIELGIPGYRSHGWNPVKCYDPVWRNTAPLLPQLGRRLGVVFPAWDVSEFRSLQAVMDVPDVNLTLVPDMHSGTRQLDWRRITAAPGAVDLAEMTLNGVYDWQLNRDQLWWGIAGYEAIGKDDALADQVFADLLVADPTNPGFAYRAAIQKALLGDCGHAAWLWRICAGPMESTSATLAERYLEYRNMVSKQDFARLQEFVISASANLTAPVVKPQVNLMGAW
jgi:hypothetical protein